MKSDPDEFTKATSEEEATRLLETIHGDNKETTDDKLRTQCITITQSKAVFKQSFMKELHSFRGQLHRIAAQYTASRLCKSTLS